MLCSYCASSFYCSSTLNVECASSSLTSWILRANATMIYVASSSRYVASSCCSSNDVSCFSCSLSESDAFSFRSSCGACAISWSSCPCASFSRSLCTHLYGRCTCEIVCSSFSTCFCTIVAYLCMRLLASQNLSTVACSRCWSRYLGNPLRVSYQSFGLRMC